MATLSLRGALYKSLRKVVQVVNDLVTLGNELRTDHATFKTQADGVETLVEELAADHATTKTAVDQTKTAVDELIDDHATFKSVVDDLKARCNQLIAHMNYRLAGNPGFAIDTNFDIKNANAISYFNGGTVKTLTANTNFDTGTAATFAATKWGSVLLWVNASGTAGVTWKTNTSAGYDSEALAIAAIADPDATYTLLGYATVQAHASNTFTAGTDALAGGTGGNVAAATNYYNTSNPNSLRLGAAVSTSSPATLAATKPTAGPATLTATTTVSSAPATLSAAAVDSLRFADSAP